MYRSKYHQTNLLKRSLSRLRRQPRGQSFIELMLVVLFLGLILAGMVEFGFLLNNYLHVLDGSREAARYSSSSTPFVPSTNGVDIASWYYPPFYYVAAGKAVQTMDPVILDPMLAEEGHTDHTDDVVVSVFTMNGVTPIRYPLMADDQTGWSLCAHYNANTDDSNAVVYGLTPPNICVGAHYGGFASYFPCIKSSVPSEVPVSTWGSSCHQRQSQFTNANLTNLLTQASVAPPSTGVVLVEIFYNYPQLLKLPVLENVLPDPIPLYVYTIMPLSAAQPTQVH